MIERFTTSTLFLEGATTPEDRRKAARTWLVEAIEWAQAEGLSFSPALALLGALDGLDHGCVDPMLKLPSGQKRGGKEASSAEIYIKAVALASIDRLMELGLTKSSAIQAVAVALGKKPDALDNLRKKVSMERSKPQAKRTKYLSLVDAFEEARATMKDRPRVFVMVHLAKLSEDLGAL